jgi:hypothetical protein
MSQNLLPKEVVHLLVRAAISCGAIKPTEGEFLRRTIPHFAVSRLIELSGRVANRDLRDEIKKYEQAVIQLPVIQRH